MSLYCEHCKVHVSGRGPRCPLCQNPMLSGEASPGVFPALSGHKSKWGILLRSLLFVSFAAVVLCVTIDTLLPDSSAWPWYVAAAVGCMWLCAANAIIRRRNLQKNILWMVFWISLLSAAWDWWTGWNHWALDYVIPFLFILSMMVISILCFVSKRGGSMVYVLLNALFGLSPLLPLSMGWVHTRYPSVLCVAISVLCLGELAVFRNHLISDEIKKRLHI